MTKRSAIFLFTGMKSMTEEQEPREE